MAGPLCYGDIAKINDLVELYSIDPDSVLHIGAGESSMEYVWSLYSFPEAALTFTDISEKALSKNKSDAEQHLHDAAYMAAQKEKVENVYKSVSLGTEYSQKVDFKLEDIMQADTSQHFDAIFALGYSAILAPKLFEDQGMRTLAMTGYASYAPKVRAFATQMGSKINELLTNEGTAFLSCDYPLFTLFDLSIDDIAHSFANGGLDVTVYNSYFTGNDKLDTSSGKDSKVLVMKHSENEWGSVSYESVDDRLTDDEIAEMIKTVQNKEK